MKKLILILLLSLIITGCCTETDTGEHKGVLKGASTFIDNVNSKRTRILYKCTACSEFYTETIYGHWKKEDLDFIEMDKKEIDISNERADLEKYIYKEESDW